MRDHPVLDITGRGKFSIFFHGENQFGIAVLTSPVIARLVLVIHLLQVTTMRYGYVYIICNRKNGTIYLGMTSDLAKRLEEHKSKSNPNSFSAKYNTCRLVWFERYDLIVDAIAREKTMKGWPRQWKINTIKRENPNWDELILDYDD